MNCQEVQERLSEYLEQSLDDASIRTVDIHLSSCRLCRAEADSLVRCIQNIAGLPMVEPPLGFAQRVMSHVREIEARPSVWERLWFPLGIKMPIHATAIVLIGVLAVYLLEKDEPHKNLLRHRAKSRFQSLPGPVKPGLYGAHGDFQDSGDLFIGYILKIFQQDNHRIVGFEAV